MNILTLTHAFRDGVHDDTAIQAWCTTNFGQVHQVFVGIDHRNPPDEDSFPLVAIYPASMLKGMDLDAADHDLLVTCGVFKEGEADTGKANVTELAGFELLEAFRKQVETRLVAVAEAQGLFFSKMDVEFQPLEVYPFFMVTMGLSFAQDYYQGSDVFA